MIIHSTTQTVVVVTCDDGATWSTRINGTLDTARDYFIGRQFTDERPETGRETTRRVYQVEILSPEPCKL